MRSIAATAGTSIVNRLFLTCTRPSVPASTSAASARSQSAISSSLSRSGRPRASRPTLASSSPSSIVSPRNCSTTVRKFEIDRARHGSRSRASARALPSFSRMAGSLRSSFASLLSASSRRSQIRRPSGFATYGIFRPGRSSSSIRGLRDLRPFSPRARASNSGSNVAPGFRPRTTELGGGGFGPRRLSFIGYSTCGAERDPYTSRP